MQVIPGALPTEKRLIRFNIGTEKPGLAPAVFIWLLCAYIQQQQINANSISFSQLLYGNALRQRQEESHALGILLKLTETQMNNLTDKVLKHIDGLSVAVCADVAQFQWHRPITEIQQQAWDLIYNKRNLTDL